MKIGTNDVLKLKEKVGIKVKRYNSRISRLRRHLGLDPNEVHINEPFKFTGTVEVKINRWNEETQSYRGWQLHDINHNLKTTAGLTFFLQQCYAGNSGGSIGTNGTNFMALSADTGAPDAAHTTLASEIDNTNGLGRAQATVVISQPTATISKTWTASGIQNAVQKGAVFTASSSGTMGHEYTFTSTNMGNQDQLQITLTVTIS